MAFGWPYFTEHLWLATADNGLAAALYSPCEVKAKVAGGAEVRIAEDTWYPFGEVIDFTVRTDREVRFPLYLRVPDWSKDAAVLINGERQSVELPAGHYALIRRCWRNGDQVRLDVRPGSRPEGLARMGGRRPAPPRAALVFSKIGEEWKRYAGTEEWPALEVLPTTPWNYGLEVDSARPEAAISVESAGAPAYQPFALEAAPIVLKAKARRLPDWKWEGRMAGKMPAGPLRPGGAAEEVRLVPMGCARLRIAVFPRIFHNERPVATGKNP